MSWIMTTRCKLILMTRVGSNPPACMLGLVNAKGGGKVSFTINAASQVYEQSSLCTWAGLSPQDKALSIE